MHISVIVPAHNEAEHIEDTLSYIKKAFEMVLLGGIPLSYEIIVVCDACNDDTFEKALKYGARTIKVENKSRAKTRNAGKDIAKGNYLLFVDADTKITPKALYQALRILKNPEYSVVGSYWDHGDYFKFTQSLINFYLNVTGTAPGYFLMCRKSQFQRFKDSPVEDIMFTCNMQKFGKIYLIKNSGIITSTSRFEKGMVKAIKHYICVDAFKPFPIIVILFFLIMFIIGIFVVWYLLRKK